MNYLLHYNKLIKSRKLLDRKKTKETYYEKHHIIARCIGGTNDEDNLVLLTFREHYIAHLLLSKIYTGEVKRKMNYALWRMSSTHNPNHKRSLSSSQYEICRKAQIEAKRNHVVTQETRDKISKGNSGKKRTSEMIEKHKNRLRGRTHETSKETRDKISKSNKNKKRTPEMNKQNSLRNLGKTQSDETKSKRNKKLTGVSRPREVVDKMQKNHPNIKEVWCSNNLIYNSVSDAARKLNFPVSSIRKVIKGIHSEYKGLSFKLLEK